MEQRPLTLHRGREGQDVHREGPNWMEPRFPKTRPSSAACGKPLTMQTTVFWGETGRPDRGPGTLAEGRLADGWQAEAPWLDWASLRELLIIGEGTVGGLFQG